MKLKNILNVLVLITVTLFNNNLNAACNMKDGKRVEVEFSKSPEPTTSSTENHNTFGYDDYDTPNDCKDDHVSVGIGKSTWIKVVITGVTDASLIHFVAKDASIITVTKPAKTPSSGFYLKITGGSTAGETTLTARGDTQTGPVCGSIKVNNYKEKVWKPVKIYSVSDSQSSGTAPAPSITNGTTISKYMNQVAKQAVSKFSDVSFATKNLRYDLNNNGLLDYYYDGGSQPEDSLFTRQSLTGSTSFAYIGALVKDVAFSWRLSQEAASGQTQLTLKGASYLASSTNLTFKLGNDVVDVVSVNGNTVTLAANLSKTYPVGTALSTVAGLGHSGNPFIAEGSSAAIIIHELLHTTGHLLDVKGNNNAMYFTLSKIGKELRHKPQAKKYESGTENQWGTIPR